MKPTAVKAVYFSPNGATRTAVVRLAKCLADRLSLPFSVTDFTLPPARNTVYRFSEGDLVVFGTPVMAGRVPNKILPFVQSGFEGNGALAVPLVTFGNRAFDNALIELRNELEHNGFHTVGGAALAARHVFSPIMAPGRPDPDDWAGLDRFAQELLDKLSALEACPPPVSVAGDDPVGPYYVPLGVDGQPTKFLKATPKTIAERCDNCGVCVKRCPMAAIDPVDPKLVPGTCIKCQACIKVCHSGAKYFDDAAFLSHVAMLEANYTRRAEPAFFL